MYPNIDTLFKTGLHKIKPGLNRIEKVLDNLDNPHLKTKYILVGGTNGKGSVSTIISKILEYNKYSVGLYTSPHLIEVTERIKINGIQVKKNRLDHFLGTIFRVCREINIDLSFFELLTVCAFLYYYEEQIDIGVLEVGMGGRWDATNVVNPIISIITNVSVDHEKYLGDTIKEIAQEKAEIIKNNGTVITAAKRIALDVIKKNATIKSAELFEIGNEFRLELIDIGKLNYRGMNWNFDNLELGTLGVNQMVNAIVAISCIEILSNKFSYLIDLDSIKTALFDTKLEGRMEYVKNDPPIILDCAHNVDAAINLVDSIRVLHGDIKFNFMISMLNDKDLKGFLEQLVPISSKIIITEFSSDRVYDVQEIERVLKEIQVEYEVLPNPMDSFKFIVNSNEPTCITGSIYLIGEIKKILQEDRNYMSN